MIESWSESSSLDSLSINANIEGRYWDFTASGSFSYDQVDIKENQQELDAVTVRVQQLYTK